MAISVEPPVDGYDQPYLIGAYAPVHDEINVAELPVTGSIPDGLRGTFLRNGPNPMFAPSGPYHLFDGDGMLHGLHLGDGAASYRNRWIRSRGLEAEAAVGRSLYGGMANASFPGPELVGDAGPMKNVANTHVVRHADRIMCLWEAGPPTLVDPSLATLGAFDFDGALVGPMTAHPKVDPITGELHFFGYSAMAPYLRYHVADSSGRLLRSVDIDLPQPVMMHDFAITDTHVVFFDAPAVFDIMGFTRGEPMIQWKPEYGTRIGVMHRDSDGSDIVWAEIDPCYVFHFLNAWSLNAWSLGASNPATGSVVIDGCRLAKPDLGLEDSDDDKRDLLGSEPDGSYLTRFTVDLASATATTEPLTELRGDFPRIDDRRTGLRNRFGYLATMTNGRTHTGRADPKVDGAFDSITQVDLADGTEAIHVFGPGRTTGEAVFAPDPSGSGEDDGWVMSYVYDAATDRSDLVVLDAHDVAGDPVATVHLPRRVPFGFHGSWLPETD